jgi:hypothetical protein
MTNLVFIYRDYWDSVWQMGGHNNSTVITSSGCTVEQRAAAMTSIAREYPSIVGEFFGDMVRLTSEDREADELTAIWWAAAANLAALHRASDGRGQIMDYLLA